MKRLSGKMPAIPDEPKATGFRVFPSQATPELLDVGEWIAISGGAVSTGLGARTNIALSILIGFFNVRLGYWWQSGTNPSDRKFRTRRGLAQRMAAATRRVFPVQLSLVDEWLARFPGVARREWNLSDGGHFENMGAYELIRRRLELIIISDNEEDADYQFSGIANLVRKARTDFGTEIVFLDQPQLDELKQMHNEWNPSGPLKWPRMPAAVTPLESLRRGRGTPDAFRPPMVFSADMTQLSRGHVAIARIDYSNHPSKYDGAPAVGYLIYIKPTLTGDEPVDVLQYHDEHPRFPQEPTADQFFDEAQWESYRRLGEHLATSTFGATGDLAKWVRHVAGAPEYPTVLRKGAPAPMKKP